MTQRKIWATMLATTILIGGAVPASAAQIVQTFDFNWNGNGSDTASFAQLDPDDGELTQVVLTINAEFANDVHISYPGVSYFESNAHASFNLILDGVDHELLLSDVKFGGFSGAADAHLADNDSRFDVIGVQPQFVGTGTILASGSATSGVTDLPNDGVHYSHSPLALHLSGTLAYTFKAGQPQLPPPVPEPASWMLAIIGFGAVGSALRRRAAPMATASLSTF
jgi:hypothetical protein